MNLRTNPRMSASVYLSKASWVGIVGTGVAFAAGCGDKQSPFLPIETATARPVAMPGRLQHVVLVELIDRSDLPAMKADSDALLPRIPSVRGYVSGTPVDIGRATVAKDYDIGIVVQFDSAAGYEAYLAHPLHQELVAKWRPKWRRSYIVDFAP